jgi:hypothetical protein
MTTKTRDDDSPDMDKVRRFLREALYYIKQANLEMVGSDLHKDHYPHPIRGHVFDAHDAVFAALESLKEEANG